MPMNAEYLNLIANQAAVLAAFIGLVDAEGNEIPGVARKNASWMRADGGFIRPKDDLLFQIPAGTTVGGWRAFSDSFGGVDYGGEDLPTETFTGQGIYTLIAAKTGIQHRQGT